MKKIQFILAAVVFSCSWAIAQVENEQADTVNTDTVKLPPPELIVPEGKEVQEIETYAKRFVPRKASLYAAILPGAGQIYNKKYWKLPLVYGGFIALGYAVNFYDVRYKLLRKELFRTLEESGYVSQFGNEQQLRNGVNSQRRDRDFYIIMLGGMYLLQIVDAHIDAHLKEFDVNPNLQVSIEPTVENSVYFGNTAGVSLKFKF